jgi:hypothetical protein
LTLLFGTLVSAEPENLLKNPGFEDEPNTIWEANGHPQEKMDAQLDDLTISARIETLLK